MKNSWKYVLLVAVMVLTFSTAIYAQPTQDLTQANELVNQAINKLQVHDVDAVSELVAEFHEQWEVFEDGLKDESKATYKLIEEQYGMVEFHLKQEPVDEAGLLEALQDLQQTNVDFIHGNYVTNESPSNTQSIKDLLVLLQTTKSQVADEKYADAVATMDDFSATWIHVEAAILTQSNQVYEDAERDMVLIKAYLKTGNGTKEQLNEVIDSMYAYLTPLASKSSYTMIDAVTIVLREGLEALMIIVALLAFLNRSGHADKKKWIYGGVGTAVGVSIVLAVIVQLIFASGSFGNNQFMINGITGTFAAVMLIYMGYWLHSKSSLHQWQNYIKTQGTKALATGSLFSLALLAFLGVLREGIEVVLFFIGMASSIHTTDLILGISIGAVILLILSFLVLKLSVRIPVRPFFRLSSLLVFYLALKFIGTGINSLQVAGVISAHTNHYLPSISWLGTYPSWEVVISQLVLVGFAITMVVWEYVKDKRVAE